MEFFMKSAESSRIFTVQKRRMILGCTLGILSLLIFCIFYSWQEGVCFGLLFCAAGCLKLQIKHPFISFAMNGFWGIVSIFIVCALPTVMVSDACYLDIGAFRIVMNFLCVAAVYGVCLACTGKIRSAVAIGSGLLMILATISSFVLQFRGTLLKPMDFLFLRTAMNVAGQYVFRIDAAMARCWAVWLLTVFVLGALPEERKLLPGIALRCAALLASAACIFLLWNRTEDVRISTWNNEGATKNGYFLNFAVGFRDFFIEEPEGYSESLIAELEDRYPQPEAVSSENLPNILVIMNESFADFNILGTPLRTNQPVTPFIDSLQENTIRGNALTSIFGGTTANAEFEFLCGMSMAYAPEGSCPYQQYITSPLFSLPYVLESCGYRSVSTHPYFSSGWNRTNVYPHLGFSESTFLEAYPMEDLVREFVSDREMYSHVLDLLRSESDAPLFLFGITMQNHGDYIYDGPNYTQTIFLEDYEMSHPMTEQYLTLLHESDKAAQYLLTELENYEEDTIVLFFGDHLPQIEGDFLLEAHGGPYETLAEQQLQYTVPFFIWANFDITEQTVPCTSLNYLGRYLLETAGIPLPSWFRFLKDLEAAVPSINADGYYSHAAGTYLPHADAEGEEAWWLQQYAALQYNAMFDKNRTSRHFFSCGPDAE